MRILVTGGAGFIGSHVAAAFLKHGHEVLVIDNLSTGKRQNVPPSAQVVVADLLDSDQLERVFVSFAPEVINHHAAHTNVRLSWDDPLRDARDNVLASLHLLRCSLRHSVQKIIYASSGGAIYGEPAKLPVREDDPVQPLSNYGVSKYTVELYLRAFWEGARLPYVVLRYPNVYGPRQDPHGEAGVVAIFAYQMLQGIQPRIFGDGTKSRDYVYVDDIAEANVRALERDGNAVVNLGWGDEITDLAVFRTVRDAVGCKVAPAFEQKRVGEVDHISLNASRARELLGWEPRVRFPEGVQHVVEYWKHALGK